tara:strand:+ start:581 stop:1492 length:912 start_codon:yes stop_codon:yes gene_type:complete
MSAFNDNRRDIKRAYRKKAFQTDMSLVRKSVEDQPLPAHSYSTPSHQQTTPLRKGIDPHTYEVDVRPAVEHLDFARMLDSARYPWHLVPKGDSANVISRAKYNFDTATGGTNIGDDDYMDVLVLNVADTVGSNTTAPATIPGPAPRPASKIVRTTGGGSTSTGTGNPNFPGQSGNTVSGVQGTINIGSAGEVYRIQSFGHSQISTSNQSVAGAFTEAEPLTYQIWIDGTLFMEWNNFQWSPVTPLESQWHFTQPLTVTKQIILRIINTTGQSLDTGDMESCFNGWGEQLSGYVDVAYQQLESN